MGGNIYGELGLGPTSSKNNPTQVGTSNWLSVSTGLAHSLAIRANGTLWAWGDNNSGELGDGTNTARDTPVQIGTATWKSVSVGMNTSSNSSRNLAIRSNGTLWTWGQGNYSYIPAQVGVEDDWSSVAASGNYFLAIKNDGSLWVWGDSLSPSFGFGDDFVGTSSVPVQVGTDNNWASVSSNLNDSMAMKNDGTLYWFRDNYNDPTNPIVLGSDWASVSVGPTHRLAIKKDGSLWAWGYNGFGQLGDGTAAMEFRNDPVRVGTDNDWDSVSAGHSHSLGIKTDGSVWAWGSTRLGSGGNRLIPTAVLDSGN